MRGLLLIGLVVMSVVLGGCAVTGPGLSPDALSAKYSTEGYVASDFHSMTPELP